MRMIVFVVIAYEQTGQLPVVRVVGVHDNKYVLVAYQYIRYKSSQFDAAALLLYLVLAGIYVLHAAVHAEA